MRQPSARWLLAGCLLSVSHLVGARASAQPSDRPFVHVELDECLPFEQGDVRRVVAAELGALLLQAAADDPDVTRVSVGCRADVIVLRVDDPVTGKFLERSVGIPRMGRAAATRLLGLAITELVTASWFELVVSPEPAIEPIEARASPSARERTLATVERRTRGEGQLRLTAGGTARMFLGGSPTFFGGVLRLGHDAFANMGWSMDLQLEHAAWPTSAGTIDGLLASTAGTLLAHGRLAFLSIQGGVGLRIGLARLAGEPNRGDLRGESLLGAWGGPILVARVLAQPVGHGIVALGWELGHATLRVSGRVTGAPDVALEGLWIAATASFGLAL